MSAGEQEKTVIISLVFYWTRQQCGCALRAPPLDPLFPSFPRSAFNFKTVGLMNVSLRTSFGWFANDSVYGTSFSHSEFLYFLFNIFVLGMYIVCCLMYTYSMLQPHVYIVCCLMCTKHMYVSATCVNSLLPNLYIVWFRVCTQFLQIVYIVCCLVCI